MTANDQLFLNISNLTVSFPRLIVRYFRDIYTTTIHDITGNIESHPNANRL